ncbi:MAG: universal stress protein [Acidimicrobiia bacterium]
MFDEVIVPIDGSDWADRSLLPAVQVARLHQARLVLMQAAHPDLAAHAEQELADRALQSRFEDPKLVVDTMRGPVAALAELVQNPRSLVCMTTHGRSGLGRVLFGSVAEEALREVDAPFLLVGPKTYLLGGVAGPVLVGLDGSKRAEAILPAALSWARTSQSPLWLVSVVTRGDATALAQHGEDIDEGAYLERLASHLAPEDVDVQWEVLRGEDPATALVDFATEANMRVIALATHGRSGLARVAMGSIATRTVHNHSGFVLAVRSSHNS